ncbi:GGDEF domain-containing protein [Bacillus sp. SCS-153A]|uniref:GGDEF domain-containing protein n=1 Tax=Rossellomorea sedimentorum TaxID=3115294 RepID=UPI003906C4ED
MNKNLGFTLFLWINRVVALGFLAYSFTHFHVILENFQTVSFLVLSILLVIARLGGLFKLFDLKVSIGWANSIEFCAAIILPFPYFCLIMFLSYLSIVYKRYKAKHPEPFLGPDINATSVVFGAFISVHLYRYLESFISTTFFSDTIALILAALVFGGIQVLLITTVISLHEKKSWRKVGTLSADSLISEGVVVMTGALIGKIFLIDPSSLLLIVIPLLLMHKSLKKISENALIYIDEKTGLHNYRYFDENLSKQFEQAYKNEKQLTLIFGDMDYLRDINNTYGHPAGDAAIASIGKMFKQVTTANMVAARFGGEEFVIIAPVMNKKEAYSFTEKLREKIASQTVEHNETSFNISMSFGIATFPEDASSVEELVQRADETLYKAKKAGRNKVMAYNSESSFILLESTSGGNY